MKLRVPTNRQEKLVDLKVTGGHNFLSNTKPILTEIYPMRQLGGNEYEVLERPAYVTTILKLVLKIRQTKDLSDYWTLILWNINQLGILPPEATVTFVRTFERRDDEAMKKEIKRRGKGAMYLTKDTGEDQEDTNTALDHDAQLALNIRRGDHVVAFGAEALITAPNDQILEEAVQALQDYMKTNEETTGLSYEIDINKQSRPFLLYGPNKASGNREVYYDMTDYDAGLSALFVDSGGDRAPGSEVVGYSVGKLISSHAAYKFINPCSLYIGNNIENRTYTIGDEEGMDIPSQTYLAKVASRAYLLEGRSVTHIVADDPIHAKHLMELPIKQERKVLVDASKGLLNILEPIRTKDLDQYPERIVSKYNMHLENIIRLLDQFIEHQDAKEKDAFGNAARYILQQFFINKKYWSNDTDKIEKLKLYGLHDQYATLDVFGAYVVNNKTTNSNPNFVSALEQLDTVVNSKILPVIPSLKRQTDPIIDRLVNAQYRVVDLTGMGTGSIDAPNSALNVMMIMYLNVILPALQNGDVIMIHGMTSMAKLMRTITSMISGAQKNIDLVFTEGNDSNGQIMLNIMDRPLDFAMVDLYENRTEKVQEQLDMDDDWCKKLEPIKSSFFVKSGPSVDFIKLDKII